MLFLDSKNIILYDIITCTCALNIRNLAAASFRVLWRELELVELMANDCPLFTEQHAQHDRVWSVPGFTLPILCIACVIERLERKDELSLHTRKVLSELRALLVEANSSKLLTVLVSDRRVLERLCGQLFG